MRVLWLKIFRRILLLLLAILPQGSENTPLAPIYLYLRERIKKIDFTLAVARFAATNRSRPRFERILVLQLRRFWWWLHPRYSGGMSRNLYIAAIVLVIFAYVAGRFIIWRSEKSVRPDSEELYRNLYGQPLVRIVYIRDWASSVAVAYLNAYLLRTKLKSEVLFKPLSQDDVSQAWAMLANDKADIFFSAWLPTQEKFAEQGKNLIQIGELTRGAQLGIAVPAWMPLHSLEDLRQFDGAIYAIDPDSKLNAQTKRALEDYAISGWQIIEKSEPYLLAQLRTAMKNGEPIFITAWSPHAMFGEFALKFLDDPRRVYGKPENINIYTGMKFAEHFPQICAFFRGEKLTLDQYSDLIFAAGEGDNVAANVKKWAEQNSDIINEWRAAVPRGEVKIKN